MDRGLRQEVRHPLNCDVAVSWQDKQGVVRFVRARGLDIAESGVRIETSEPLEVNSYVFVKAEEFGVGGTAQIRHCTPRGDKFIIGVALHETKANIAPAAGGDAEDYYELLQISPAAEMETIHRVYRILVARYHPDNPHTGNLEKFLQLTRAHDTLSNPQSRAEYDSQYCQRKVDPIPVFELKEFVGGIDAEVNRRLGMLCLLYNRRRMDPDKPGLSLLDFEQLMSIPREHLMFTVWFLKEKGHVRTDGSSAFEISAAGVEFVETSVPANRLLRQLLPASEDLSGGAGGAARP